MYKYEPKTTVDWAVQNDNKPLWTRSPKEVRGDEPCRVSRLRAGFTQLGKPPEVVRLDGLGSVFMSLGNTGQQQSRTDNNTLCMDTR